MFDRAFMAGDDHTAGLFVNTDRNYLRIGEQVYDLDLWDTALTGAYIWWDSGTGQWMDRVPQDGLFRRKWTTTEVAQYYDKLILWERWKWLPASVKRYFGLPTHKPSKCRVIVYNNVIDPRNNKTDCEPGTQGCL